ncbi:hypothetical protein P4S52_12225 [Vibrio sp. SA48]|nr:hypothetical protein [Vibrio sp. S12_S33]
MAKHHNPAYTEEFRKEVVRLARCGSRHDSSLHCTNDFGHI